jgi:hypothetical protein
MPKKNQTKRNRRNWTPVAEHWLDLATQALRTAAERAATREGADAVAPEHMALALVTANVYADVSRRVRRAAKKEQNGG